MSDSLPRKVSVPYSLAVGTLLSFVTVIGLAANVLVVVAILGDKKLRKSAMNMLLLNLAVADFLYLISFMPIWMPMMYYGTPGWFLPGFLCPVDRYASNCFIMASIATYMAICVERYIATVHPMKVKHLCSRKKVLALIALIWSVVLVCELPYYILWYAYDVPKRPVTYVVYNETMIPIYDITYTLYNGSVVPVYHTTMTAIPGILACINESWTHPLWKVFRWTEFALSYVLPIALSVVLYTKICRVLWTKNQFLHKDKVSASKPSSSTEENGVVTKEKSAEEAALASRRTVVKMLMVCVAVFFLCYTPMISLTIWT
ncbi:Protein NPR-15, partial [Aphelenchoides avenae]